jgi:hypothetical protein
LIYSEFIVHTNITSLKSWDTKTSVSGFGGIRTHDILTQQNVLTG